jgi:hypothetical protein
MTARGPYLLFDLADNSIAADALDLDGVEAFLMEAY